LLAVLPGTGGLTRLTDKRKVRRDLADVFCTTEEGVRGQRAVEWRLVDEIVPPSAWEATVQERARAMADRPPAQGIRLTTLQREIAADTVKYPHVRVALDRRGRRATITLLGPETIAAHLAAIHAAGDTFWPLALARELDDALLHLRLNEPDLGLLVFRSEGDPQRVLAADALLTSHAEDWLIREITLLLKRVLKRVDMTSRSIITLIEPGSCFAGILSEVVFAADRSVMHATAALHLSALNFGPLPMGNDHTRLETRFLGEPDSVGKARAQIGLTLDAATADILGLVTAVHDDIDWDDEVRLLLEERASFSPDALTGLEANLRFAGPETMETRIFGRLTAWQNWIFQRPNAVGDNGSLKRYGTGERPTFDPQRV
jgi:benzoyl-CoA-dihydrodiol lyase